MCRRTDRRIVNSWRTSNLWIRGVLSLGPGPYIDLLSSPNLPMIKVDYIHEILRELPNNYLRSKMSTDSWKISNYFIIYIYSKSLANSIKLMQQISNRNFLYFNGFITKKYCKVEEFQVDIPSDWLNLISL